MRRLLFNTVFCLTRPISLTRATPPRQPTLPTLDTRHSLPLVFCFLLSACCFSLRAQPANDNFANAQVLPSAFWASVTNDNTGATAEASEPSHAGFVPTNSIWYRWTAPMDGEVTVDTVGSGTNLTFFDIDTVLAVYEGTNLNALRQVAANDDLFPFKQETISDQIFP